MKKLRILIIMSLTSLLVLSAEATSEMMSISEQEVLESDLPITLIPIIEEGLH